MLIYNFQKEFVGIDEKDLKTLGFKNLGELRTEVLDFADLFVKTPGFIHNFKHVHWIDFITCADSNEESKVIINVNNKNYRCIIHITTAYLIDNPTSKSYIVTLQNLRELSHKESESIAGDIIQREAPQAIASTQAIFNTPEHTETFEADEVTSLVTDDYDAPLEIDMLDNDTASLTVDDFDTKETISPFEENIIKEDDLSAPLEISFDDDDLDEELLLDISSKDEEITPPKPLTEVTQESFDNGYIYDPSVASEELGLPLDLIEEFIGDFIEQAKEFKDELYQSIDNGDFDTLKILSHKLKGVAANLRIEDALEALTVANSSSDFNEITENMDTLYKIVAKLAGEEISVEKEIIPEIQEVPVEEISIAEVEEEVKIEIAMDDDLYSDPIEVEDSQVPEKIELAELADDLFVETPNFQEDEEELSLEIQSIDYSKESVAKEIGLDIESFNELFNDFIRESNALMLSMTDAIEKDDLSLTSSEAIKFKGMSDNMRVTGYEKELETLINSQDKIELSTALKTINSTLQTLVK